MTTRDKLIFVSAMSRATSATVRQCEALMRLTSTLQKLGTFSIMTSANGIAAKRERIQRKVTEICLTITSIGISPKTRCPWRTTCPKCGLVQQGRQLCNSCGEVCPSETPRCVAEFTSGVLVRVPGGEGIVVPHA